MTIDRLNLDPKSWSLRSLRAPDFVHGEVLAELADAHPQIVVLTADLGYSGRTIEFADRHPDRFINVGIAEKNMMGIAAGLASTGKLPYVTTFAAYASLLAAENLRTDIAFTQMPVRILAHHSGMTLGFYGTSHHALEDIALVRGIARLPIVSATDAPMLRAILEASVDLEGPLYIRMGRGRDPQVHDPGVTFDLGASYRLRDGDDVAVLATGSLVAPAVAAADALAQEGIGVRVVDLASIKPLDAGAVLDAATQCRAVLTAEEHNITGGLGSAVCEVLAEAGVAVALERHGIKDEYVIVGPPAGLYAHYGLDAAGVAARVRELVARA